MMDWKLGGWVVLVFGVIFYVIFCGKYGGFWWCLLVDLSEFGGLGWVGGGWGSSGFVLGLLWYLGFGDF